ncbi:MAG TPA: hypothetical protein VF062_08300 [Candidatus Limnocylindrales bacterium]
MPVEFQDLARGQVVAEQDLMALPNVVGVALGEKSVGGVSTGERAIVVLVDHKIDALSLPESAAIPRAVLGMPTDVREVGVIRAPEPVEPLATVQAVSLVGRQRPVRGGLSVGHPGITAGTIGAACYDAKPFPGRPDRYYILSNNHVLANSNEAAVGDSIVQPGAFDGGTADNDVIGKLVRFVPIKFTQEGTPEPPVNEVDAAIAEVDLADLERAIHWVGRPTHSIIKAEIDLVVTKCGRTTGFTTGKIVNLNATVNVNYGPGKVARFVGQLITTPMSAPGDSGSLMTTVDGGAVGLLFAGSAQATVVNPIEAVLRLLQIRVSDA